MTLAAETADWRRKYFDSIRAIESEERQFRDLEKILRQLVSKLCVAAQGQSSRLDEELRRLSDAIRGNAGVESLEGISPRLIAAVNETDRLVSTQTSMHTATTVVMDSSSSASAIPAGETPAEAIFGDDHVRSVLAALIADLRRDTALVEDANGLEKRLEVSLTREELPPVLADLAELVARRIRNIERAKGEVETLLAQMLGRLEDMTGYVAVQSDDQTLQLESSATLTIQLSGEVKAIGESVEHGTDLALIRRQLRTRLDAIGRHMEEYRDRENLRVQSIRDRNEQMRQRVEQLEVEARKLHAQLVDEQRLSLIDGLTQISNRQAFELRFDEELGRFQRFGRPTCVAIWDIDHFKAINDNFGHRAGDKVLRVVAECLAGGIRSTDFIARYGGEEFVLLLPGTRVEDAMRVMEALRTGVARTGFHFRGSPVSVTISCGITQLREGDVAGDAFDRADKALYAAKDSGRNRCHSG